MFAVLCVFAVQQTHTFPQQKYSPSRPISAHELEDGIKSQNSLLLQPQDAGYILVNETSHANMFYWYIPPQNNDPEAPIILWLQGGPGSSGIVDGLFLEHGPYAIDGNGNLVTKDITWTREFGVIYVDNPVGTGFSYVEDDSGYVTNHTQVAQDLIVFLEGFFATHASIQQNDFYVMGESFGGHYVPALASALLDLNEDSRMNGRSLLVPNFRGISLGDGLVDPVTQITVTPSAAHDFGLVDQLGEQQLIDLASLAVQQIHEGNFAGALSTRTILEQLIVNATAINLMDVRTTGSYKSVEEPIEKFLELQSTRVALNVGNHTFGENTKKVAEYLYADHMTSTAYFFPKILSQLKVLLYQGQFDLKDGTRSNEMWIQNIPWPGAQGFFNSARCQWQVQQQQLRDVSGTTSTEIAGFVRSYSNLTNVVVRNAGHMAPMDQLGWTFDMITRFVRDVSFNSTCH